MIFIDEGNYCTAQASGLASSKRDTGTLKGLLDDSPVSLRKVTDGLSKTFMFFEDSGRPLYRLKGAEQNGTNPGGGARWADKDQYYGWGNADPATGCGLSTVMNCTNDNETYSFHTNGCNFLFGDGSVNFITESVDLDTYISLITKAADDIAKDRP